jgi:hypothetical protein
MGDAAIDFCTHGHRQNRQPLCHGHLAAIARCDTCKEALSGVHSSRGGVSKGRPLMVKHSGHAEHTAEHSLSSSQTTFWKAWLCRIYMRA